MDITEDTDDVPLEELYSKPLILSDLFFINNTLNIDSYLNVVVSSWYRLVCFPEMVMGFSPPL